MPGTFYGWWTEAKDAFEYAAGKKLKDQGERNANTRVGKGGKAADLRVKKPTKTGKFGQRTSAGIGRAAKGLDQALLQEGKWKAREEALKAFSEKAKAYALQLDEAKNNEYKSVEKEIDALKKDLRAITTRFGYLITDNIALDTIVKSGNLPTTWVGLRSAFNKAVDAKDTVKDALKEYPTALKSLEDFQSRFSEAFQASYWKARTSLLDFRDKFVKKINNVDKFQAEWVEEKRKRVASDLKSFALVLDREGLDDDGMLEKIKSEQQRFMKKLTRPHNDARISMEMVDEKKCRALSGSGVADLLDNLDEWYKDVKAELAVRKAKVQQIRKEVGIR